MKVQKLELARPSLVSMLLNSLQSENPNALPGTIAMGVFLVSIKCFRSLGPVDPSFTPSSSANIRKAGAK